MNNNGKIHRFEESLAWGEAAGYEPFWKAVYLKAFPGMVSMSRNSDNNEAQYLGIDRWIQMSSGRVLLVDEKKRRKDYGDIAIEYLSNDRTGTPGWIEKDLQIDYLAYAVIPIQRCRLFPWHMLRRAWAHYGEDWKRSAKREENGFRVIAAQNPTYRTLSIAIPTKILCDAVNSASVIDVSVRLEENDA